MTATVRPIEPRDEPRWRELWDGYTRFYEREPAELLTRHTWQRILDPAAPIHALVAESPREVVGIANYVIHENTSTLSPVCYLQDLFVDPQHRGGGVGRALIDWLVAEMKRQGWSRLYWNTRRDNARARGLYDQYTEESGFVRYVLHNEERWK
jgi:GNAT superfamily N-acetyltransferase